MGGDEDGAVGDEAAEPVRSEWPAEVVVRGDWGDQLVTNDVPVTVEADAIAGYRDDALEEREGGAGDIGGLQRG